MSNTDEETMPEYIEEKEEPKSSEKPIKKKRTIKKKKDILSEAINQTIKKSKAPSLKAVVSKLFSSLNITPTTENKLFLTKYLKNLQNGHGSGNVGIKQNIRRKPCNNRMGRTTTSENTSRRRHPKSNSQHKR